MNIIKVSISTILSSVIFAIIFRLMYENNLSIQEIINEEIPSGIKGIWYIRWGIIVIVAVITAWLINIGLSEILGSSIVGMFIALTDEALKERN